MMIKLDTVESEFGTITYSRRSRPARSLPNLRRYPRDEVRSDRRCPYSDFRKVWLKRQVLNFGTLDPNVAICRFVQLYKRHSSFIF
jgi:hypothetical protein